MQLEQTKDAGPQHKVVKIYWKTEIIKQTTERSQGDSTPSINIQRRQYIIIQLLPTINELALTSIPNNEQLNASYRVQYREDLSDTKYPKPQVFGESRQTQQSYPLTQNDFWLGVRCFAYNMFRCPPLGCSAEVGTKNIVCRLDEVLK